MRRAFLSFSKFLKYRQITKLAGFGVSIAAFRSIYQKYNTILCEEDELNSNIQNQVMINENQSNQNDEENQDVQDEQEGIIKITNYQELSNLIYHHRTQSECVVFLPNCSKETKKIILKSMQEKRKDKHLKVFRFSPSKTIPNVKLEKKELIKEKDLSDKLKGVEFFGINSFGDLKFFSLDLKNAPQIPNEQEQFLTPTFQRMMNFFSPPQLISEREFPQLVHNINELLDDERIIISYIPKENVYNANLPKFNTFDLYRQGKIKNIVEIEKKFRNISYEYIEKNTKFIIIREQDLASNLSIGKDDIGDIFILKRTSKLMNNESNWFFQGKEYLYNKIEWDPNTDNSLQLSQSQILEKLYQRNFNYVNAINTEQDLNNFLTSANESGIKKILIYYSAEVIENDYEAKITKKLISVKKNIDKQDFVILFTKNPQLLKNVFRIIPDRYSDTIRLLNYSQNQQNNTQIDNKLKDWVTFALYPPISTPQIQQYSKEYMIQNEQNYFQKYADRICRYKYEGKTTRNKLTQFVKQSLEQKQQQHFEVDYSAQQYSSRYLNSVNFNQEILHNKTDDICVVYFYKPGCPNCNAMSKAIEKFNTDLEIIKGEISSFESGQKEYKVYDECLINQYRLQNFNKFKNVKIYRYCIYNECKEFPSPSSSPLVFIFTKDNRLKPVQTDLLKDRVNINDQEKVTKYFFKKLDNLQF